MKIKCALIGPGNIGTDLLYKLKRSPVLEPVWMVGIDPTSEGLARARELGLKTTAEGVDGLLAHVKADGVQIAFDATSAYVHAENSRKLNELGVLMIDLTPAAVGPFCVPPEPRRACWKARDEREHGHLGRPGHHPHGGGGVAGAAGGLWRDRRHRVEQIGRSGHPQEHRRIHPHHLGAVEKVAGPRSARRSSSSTRPSRR